MSWPPVVVRGRLSRCWNPSPTPGECCLNKLPQGKVLRILLPTGATVVWSDDLWKNTKKTETLEINVLGVWFADFPTTNLPDGSVIEFTFFFKEAQRWEGGNHPITIGGTI